MIAPKSRNLTLTQGITSAAEIATYSATNASNIDCHGVPQREFELIAEAGLLSAPL